MQVCSQLQKTSSPSLLDFVSISMKISPIRGKDVVPELPVGLFVWLTF